LTYGGVKVAYGAEGRAVGGALLAAGPQASAYLTTNRRPLPVQLVGARLHAHFMGVAERMAMFALVVRFDCRDQAAVTRFDELTAAVVEQITEREPGTLVYATHSVEGDPLARIFYEVYRDRDAFAAHEAAEHVQQFHARKDPLLVGRRVEFLSPASATGLVAA
jgi:quinol monooxygenase YgiN